MTPVRKRVAPATAVGRHSRTRYRRPCPCSAPIQDPPQAVALRDSRLINSSLNSSIRRFRSSTQWNCLPAISAHLGSFITAAAAGRTQALYKPRKIFKKLKRQHLNHWLSTRPEFY